MTSPRERQLLVALVIAVAAVCGIVAVAQAGSGESAASPGPQSAAPAATAGQAALALTPASADPTASSPSTAAPAATGAPAEDQDLDGGSLTTSDSCLMSVLSLRLNDTGTSVGCLQQALVDAGAYDGPVSGQFDEATYAAVRQVQEERNLFVDGVVGRESAISLGIWPDEESFVVRTPPPPQGAVDLMGYPLSSVATSGPDAPPLPESSGSGKRVVYDRAGQRVWAIDEDGTVIRSWLVSGSKYSNEVPGTHRVYSKSAVSTAWNGKAYLPKMVRYYQTDIGHIGFHGIPTHVSDGTAYQTEAELGTRLSGGCQRQANRDAAFLWDFADIGTTVVVV